MTVTPTSSSRRLGAARAAAGRLRRTANDAGVNQCVIADTPIAVVDVETTGLKAGDDRIVELCIVRLEADQGDGRLQRTVLSTLINPERAMGATHVHGITAEHIGDAPTFAGIVEQTLAALRGCVIAGWNAHFDVRFLEAEFQSVGLELHLPFVCSMRLRSMARLGPPISLKRACEAHAIPLVGHHSAESDTVATAHLTSLCLDALPERRVHRFGDLRRLHAYAFTKSFRHPMLAGDETLFVPKPQPLLTRVQTGCGERADEGN